jgi:hypothetical protein
MQIDDDFKPITMPDGSVVYTNLEKVCAGLPEWNDYLWCSTCRKPVTTMKDIHFFRFEAGKDLWFKVFHEECLFPHKENQKAEG